MEKHTDKITPFIPILLGLFLVFLALAYWIQAGDPPGISGTQPRLRAVGNQLVRMDTGESQRLRGFVSNYFRYPRTTTTLGDLLKRIDKAKELGGNTIDFYYTPSNMNEETLHSLDVAVNYAGERGFYVVMEMTAPSEIVMSRKGDVVLREVAARYRDKPYVILGTWAESYSDAPEELAPRLREMVKIVREANPDTPIVISGAAFGRRFEFWLKDGLPDPNIILSVHDFQFQDISHHTGKLYLEIDKPDLEELRKNVPVLYGEFGGFWGGDFSSAEDLAIIKKQLEKADEYGLSTMGYVLDYPEFPGLGLLDENGNVTPRGVLFRENYAAHNR